MITPCRQREDNFGRRPSGSKLAAVGFACDKLSRTSCSNVTKSFKPSPVRGIAVQSKGLQVLLFGNVLQSGIGDLVTCRFKCSKFFNAGRRLRPSSSVGVLRRLRLLSLCILAR